MTAARMPRSSTTARPASAGASSARPEELPRIKHGHAYRDGLTALPDWRITCASFLHNGTVAMFEQHGFERTRQLGKHHWLVTRTVGG